MNAFGVFGVDFQFLTYTSLRSVLQIRTARTLAQALGLACTGTPAAHASTAHSYKHILDFLPEHSAVYHDYNYRCIDQGVQRNFSRQHREIRC